MPEYRNDGLSPRIVSGLSGLSITVRPGESVETYNILVGPRWTKISDEPYAPLTSIRKSVTAPGSVSGLRDSALISLVADAAGIVVTPNAAGNEHGFELPKGVVVKSRTWARSIRSILPERAKCSCRLVTVSSAVPAHCGCGADGAPAARSRCRSIRRIVYVSRIRL